MPKIFTDFRGMIANLKKCDFFPAFEKEMKIYWDNSKVIDKFREIVWNTVELGSIGDLMLIFDIQLKLDVSHDSKNHVLNPTLELLFIGAQLLPDCLWSEISWQNFMAKLDYNQRSAIPEGTPMGEDTTTTIRILLN